MVVCQGANAPRVVLMLCCQLASLMIAAPALMAAYAPQLQRLLLYGSSARAEGGEVTPACMRLHQHVRKSACIESVAARLTTLPTILDTMTPSVFFQGSQLSLD